MKHYGVHYSKTHNNPKKYYHIVVNEVENVNQATT